MRVDKKSKFQSQNVIRAKARKQKNRQAREQKLNSEAAELGITVTALQARKWHAYQEASLQLIEQRAADAIDLQNRWNARWA